MGLKSSQAQLNSFQTMHSLAHTVGHADEHSQL